MSDIKDKVLRLLDDRELRNLFDVEKVRKLVGEKALNEWADTCDCPKCQANKQKNQDALKTGVKDLKKKLAKYEGVYEAILSTLGLDENKDFENVHFTFSNDTDNLGSHDDVVIDGVKHTFININVEIIAKRFLTEFEVNSPEDTRKAADEADIMTVEAVVHELQHLKQYRDKRLVDAEKDNEGRRCLTWEGNRYRDYQPSENYQAYRNLPWEIEARSVARRITDELSGTGRLPDRPTPRQKVPKRDILDGIDNIMKSLGITPISIAQQNDGQIVELDGKGKAKPLTAADAQKLLDLIDSGKATFVAGISRENGQPKSYTGDEARRSLADHLKKLVQQEKPATVH